MGFDINVYILCGYKIPLNVAFEYNLLDPAIMDGDDWQLTDEFSCRNDIIERQVTSPILKNFLLDNQDMNLYILTSTQEDFDIPNSYLYLYDGKTVCCQGSPPDYSTGVIDRDLRTKNLVFPDHYALLEIPMPDTFKWSSDLHWIVESSW